MVTQMIDAVPNDARSALTPILAGPSLPKRTPIARSPVGYGSMSEKDSAEVGAYLLSSLGIWTS
jgi:hypothetical protein